MSDASSRTSPIVVPLDQVDERDRGRVGDKACVLGELQRAGIDVPAGFVISTLAFDTRDSGRTLTRATVSGIVDAYEHLSLQRGGGGQFVPVAVRASFVSPDGRSLSFAGVGSSFTNVLGPAAVVRRVQDCVRSNVEARAVAYRTCLGLRGPTPVAVIVQAMVPAERSAVLLSLDPGSWERDDILVEAVLGMGEVIADGSVEPDRFVIDRRTGSSSCRAFGHQALLLSASRGCSKRRHLLHQPRGEPVLGRADLARVREVLERVEAVRGGPQEIDVAIDGHAGVHVLRARTMPTTTQRDRSIDRARSCADASAGDVRRGIAASAGCTSGPARVIRSGATGSLVDPGGVMVTPSAGPGAIAMLNRPAAVVADRGGAASNLAAICRELGIPAVMGAVDASTAIAAGAEVVVDGSVGTVRVEGDRSPTRPIIDRSDIASTFSR